MTDPSATTPIVVNANPATDQIEAGVRALVLAAAAVATALGYVGAAGKLSALLLAAGPIAGLIAFVWGQVKARTLSIKAATMADHLDDSIAQTK